MLFHSTLVVLYLIVLCYVGYHFWKLDKRERDEEE